MHVHSSEKIEEKSGKGTLKLETIYEIKYYFYKQTNIPKNPKYELGK